MKPNRTARFGKPAARFIFGCVGLAVVAAACFFLQIGLAATAFCYLVVILLFALTDSFLASGLLILPLVLAAPPADQPVELEGEFRVWDVKEGHYTFSLKLPSWAGKPYGLRERIRLHQRSPSGWARPGAKERWPG